MQRDQQKFLEDHWDARAPGLPFATPEQALILASIVEKETAHPAERRHIAAVFINRLKLGMKLQSDPTIIYGITKGYPLGRRIRQSEIERATPYNTYAITGLPPTPICNPGQGLHRGRAQPRSRTTSISWPTERAAMSSPTTSPSTRRTSPNGARSRKRSH